MYCNSRSLFYHSCPFCTKRVHWFNWIPILSAGAMHLHTQILTVSNWLCIRTGTIHQVLSANYQWNPDMLWHCFQRKQLISRTTRKNPSLRMSGKTLIHHTINYSTQLYYNCKPLWPLGSEEEYFLEVPREDLLPHSDQTLHTLSWWTLMDQDRDY